MILISGNDRVSMCNLNPKGNAEFATSKYLLLQGKLKRENNQPTLQYDAIHHKQGCSKTQQTAKFKISEFIHYIAALTVNRNKRKKSTAMSKVKMQSLKIRQGPLHLSVQAGLTVSGHIIQ